MPWLSFDASLAYSRARFRDEDPAGDRIPGAIEGVATAGASLNGVKGWFGSVRLRYFGPRPLIEDNRVRSKASRVVNAQVGYKLRNGWRLKLDLYNLFDAKVSDIDYFYTSRLRGEPAEGTDDIHTHPFGPLSVRGGVSASF